MTELGETAERASEMQAIDAFDLSALSVKDLLQLESGIVRELRHRDLVRTINKPLGDIAEQVVWLARGGVLEPNSTKSHDITTSGGQRIQVKAMTVRKSGRSAKFSPFRSLDFDTAVFLVFENVLFDLVEAYEVTANDIHEHVRLVPHINGRQPTLRKVEGLGWDISLEMGAAYERLNHGLPVPVESAD
ncbi:hypothetical protein [Nesterenkonia sp. DZ6]|uniref:hypothetical protein n=1 Tax=Nesterenkonia sp. DZ6 TaxID=2901229 RepID=UPI001F4C582C|nr:hypothetical protein [Nesterenkonia sp. DZ6]MCH8559678.1 hypothetical protein [Nesterenkonia sp. DZ6]